MRDLRITPLKDDEMEALFLTDYRGLAQEEAAELMNISRPTFSRVLSIARKAVATALAEGNALKIGGGHFRHIAGHNTVTGNPDERKGD